MAQLRKPIHDDGAVNAGEQRLQDFLCVKLPSNYIVIPNLNISITGPNRVMKYWEYDCIVVAPHAVYHIENKDWGGNLEGDDWAWFRSGQEVANPHKTAGLKSRILASKIKNLHPDWRFGQILTAVTLSNPQQSKFGLDPQCDCYKQTFTLGGELIDVLTKPELVGRTPGMIMDIQPQLVDLLSGQSVERRRRERKEIFNYLIEEVLQETEWFTEYLCVPKLIATSQYKVREYPATPAIDRPSVSFTPLSEIEYTEVVAPDNQSNSPTQSDVVLAPEPVVEPAPKQEPVDPNYQKPSCDVIIGKNSDSPQFGILGKMNSNGRVIGLDLNECNTISLFGVQGAGKSYTIGSITEMVLRQFSKVNLLPAPMASVIFHYSDSMDYAPEFTSMVYPNDDAGQLAKLKAEYGAEPGNIKDVVLLAPESQVETRKAEYPDIEVHSIGFDSSELSVKDWMFLLGAMGNDSTYIKELKQIMKSCRNDMSLVNIRNGVADSNHMSTSQRSLAEQKLDFAEEYITDGNMLQQYMKPGRLIIVDLRDEFIEKDEALGLFVVMLNIFSSVMKVDGRAFNKFIVFDEAHKYMNNKELVGSITTAIREMRHKGVSIMIASQDPMSLPTEIIELSSIVVMHKFSSPAWVKHVQKAITPLQILTATEMAALGSGEAYLWANKASDKAITQRPIKINVRPRVTKHGGDTIQAVK